MNRIPVPEVRARSFCVTPSFLRVSRIRLPICAAVYLKGSLQTSAALRRRRRGSEMSSRRNPPGQMLRLVFTLLVYLRGFLRSRHDLGLEILALRQQLAVLKRKRPRPHLKRRDRLFWVMLHLLWDRWHDALILVEPDTVVGWHRSSFRLYWRVRSRAPRFGRPIGGADNHTTDNHARFDVIEIQVRIYDCIRLGLRYAHQFGRRTRSRFSHHSSSDTRGVDAVGIVPAIAGVESVAN
jgi:hypothetical protein